MRQNINSSVDLRYYCKIASEIERRRLPLRLTVILGIAFVLLIPTSFLYGDIIHLKNGNQLEGRITEEAEEYVWLEVERGGTRIWKDEIASIERGPITSPIEDETAAKSIPSPASPSPSPVSSEQRISPETPQKTQKSPAGRVLFFVLLIIAGLISTCLLLFRKKLTKSVATPEATKESIPEYISRPFLIKCLISTYFLKGLLVIAGFLFFWSMMRNDLVPIDKSRVFPILIMVTSVFVFIYLAQAIGFLYMRGWARILIIFLVLFGVVTKLIYLSFNYDVRKAFSQLIFSAQEHKPKQQFSLRDFSQILQIIKMGAVIDSSAKSKGPSPSLKDLSGLLSRLRQKGTELAVSVQAEKLFVGFWLFIDFLLLLYLLRRQRVIEAFNLSGAIPFKHVFRIRSLVIICFVFLFLAVLGDRVYAFVVWKALKVPDHLSTHPATVRETLVPEPKLLQGFTQHRVLDYKIYLPGELLQPTKPRRGDFGRFFVNKDKSFLCSIMPLEAQEYNWLLAGKKARWNPVFLILKGIARPKLGRQIQMKLIHSKYWQGCFTEYQKYKKQEQPPSSYRVLKQKPLQSIFIYELLFENGRGLNIAFFIDSHLLDRETLNTIVASIEPS